MSIRSNGFALQLAAHPLARFTGGLALGVVVWKFSSSALQDIIVFGAALAALLLGRVPPEAAEAVDGPRRSVWRQPAGLAFIAVVVYHLLALPFSLSPEMSVHGTLSMLEVLAGAFAIPVIFNTERRIESALFYSAAAIALVLACDLLRMSWFLGGRIFDGAHSFKPFALNHSNVASMMAGLAFFVFGLFARRWRARRLPALGCASGALVCLFYMLAAASRGPQIAFALAAALGGFVFFTGWKRKLAWLALLAALAAILAFNIERVNPRFAEKASMTNFSERDRVWKHTWLRVCERPWFGHGYGKETFEMVYYSTHPPRARYHFPHPHQYWLKLLFEYGVAGTFLYAAAWTILFAGLARKVFRTASPDDRILPLALLVMLLFIHLYGLGDYPDNIVQVAQIWLIPVALVVLNGGHPVRICAPRLGRGVEPDHPASMASMR